MNNNLNIEDRVVEILDELGYLYNNSYPDKKALKNATNELLTLIKEICNEVVGQDEPPAKLNGVTLPRSHNIVKEIEARNDFRHQQRTKLKELLK